MGHRIALVIAGMQSRYLADVSVPAQAEIADGVVDILRARKGKMLVVFIEYAGGGKTVSSMRQLVTSHLHREYQEMTRRHRSVLIGTELDAFLRPQGVDTIIVAGVHASYFVRDTVADAIKAGYRVATAPDLTADNPAISVRKVWKWYGKKTTFYAHSAELIGIEIG